MGVWFHSFLFLFLLKIKNDDENTFCYIFKNIFSENIFSNKSKTRNNKISIKIEKLILNKIKIQLQRI